MGLRRYKPPLGGFQIDMEAPKVSIVQRLLLLGDESVAALFNDGFLEVWSLIPTRKEALSDDSAMEWSERLRIWQAKNLLQLRERPLHRLPSWYWAAQARPILNKASCQSALPVYAELYAELEDLGWSRHPGIGKAAAATAVKLYQYCMPRLEATPKGIPLLNFFIRSSFLDESPEILPMALDAMKVAIPDGRVTNQLHVENFGLWAMVAQQLSVLGFKGEAAAVARRVVAVDYAFQRGEAGSIERYLLRNGNRLPPKPNATPWLHTSTGPSDEAIKKYQEDIDAYLLQASPDFNLQRIQVAVESKAADPAPGASEAQESTLLLLNTIREVAGATDPTG